MNVQTSENRPITVSWILPDQLGLCFCPGKCHTRGDVKLERNLKTDLCRLKDCYNVQCIVCLLNDAELRVSKQVGLLSMAVAPAGFMATALWHSHHLVPLVGAEAHCLRAVPTII